MGGDRVQGSSEGLVTPQTAAQLGLAQHLGPGTCLYSPSPGSQKESLLPGRLLGPWATLVLGRSGSEWAPWSPASLMPLHLLSPWACLAHRPRPSADEGAPHRLPGSGLGLARSRLPTLSTPCSQASLEDKQDGGQDARGQAPEDAKVEEASTRREQPAGGEDGDECTPEDKVGRAPGLGGHPLAQPCPVHPDCPAPPYRSRSLSPSS